MTKNRFASCFAGAFLAVAVLPATSLAHHSVAGNFDRDMPVTFEGVVTRVQWRNPHVWLYVDSTDAEGNDVHWEIEAANPNSLARRGWKRDSLEPGDRVRVEAIRARCCENVVNTQSVTLADGTQIFAGEAESN